MPNKENAMVERQWCEAETSGGQGIVTETPSECLVYNIAANAAKMTTEYAVKQMEILDAAPSAVVVAGASGCTSDGGGGAGAVVSSVVTVVPEVMTASKP
jgi:hypothetical protein